MAGDVGDDHPLFRDGLVRALSGSDSVDVIAEADYTGSTAGMIKWVMDKKPARVVLVTECSMASNVAAEAPDTNFTRPCNLCPHMKRISLPKILDSLVFMKEEVTVDPAVAARARLAVERMVNLPV